jgi:hypothetical protein
MDFIVGLPHTQARYDSVLIIVDSLTKVVLAVIKCIYLLPTYLYFIQDIEDM